MPEVESITWRELTGNKFNVALHPAMLTEAGYQKQQAIRKTGDTAKSIFYVTYDREYVLTYIARNLCNRFFSLGKAKIIELVETAWESTYPNATDKAITFPTNN